MWLMSLKTNENKILKKKIRFVLTFSSEAFQFLCFKITFYFTFVLYVFLVSFNRKIIIFIVFSRLNFSGDKKISGCCLAEKAEKCHVCLAVLMVPLWSSIHSPEDETIREMRHSQMYFLISSLSWFEHISSEPSSPKHLCPIQAWTLQGGSPAWAWLNAEWWSS